MPKPKTEFPEGMSAWELFSQLESVPAHAHVLAQDIATGQTYRVISTLTEPATWDPETGERQTRAGVFLRLKEEKG